MTETSTDTVPSLRVATRRFGGDCLPHLYRVAELGDEKVNFLQPPAHAKPYHDFHPRSQLSTTLIPSPAALTDTCSICDRWFQENRDGLLVRREVRA